MTGLLALAAVAVGLTWLGTVRRHDRDAVTPTPTFRQIAAEGLLFAVTLGLALGAVASMLPGVSA